MCIISYYLGHPYAAFPRRLLPAVGAGTAGAALGGWAVLCRLGARCSTRALSTACLLLIYMHQAVRHAATSAQRAGHG
eukprot:scaffold10173_cov119-Isochrysis_galbana.AAC.8